MKHKKKTIIFTYEQVGAGMMVFGGAVLLIGYWFKTLFLTNPWIDLFSDFYPNIVTDSLSIGFGILVIDRLYRQRDAESEKRTLISQLGRYASSMN